MSRMRVALLCGLLGLAALARAQDFAGAAPAGNPDVLALLEMAQPPPLARIEFAAASTRWWGLRELETRTLAAGAGWRALRAGVGLSQTGDPPLGWTTLALAAGGATRVGGAAVRVAVRRGREAPWAPASLVGEGASYEVGTGAWLVVAPAWRVWASAPQLHASGPAPALERPLELGLRAGGATALWCVLRAPRAGDDGERALGAVLGMPPFEVWALARDAPWRASAGLRASAGPVRVGLRADSHPVLQESWRVSLEWRSPPAREP